MAGAIVDFVANCGLSDADVHAGNLKLAIEYSRWPLPSFWRDFALALSGVVPERSPIGALPSRSSIAAFLRLTGTDDVPI
ncbi:hypothetical protein CR51_40965 [Caballeronia megalochromosomata]|nr:hypothetical protein CR51_40965 [Caballeronia megalochromosomata]